MMDDMAKSLFKPFRPTPDPSKFGDPVAAKTDWFPAKGGGVNLCTHKAVLVDSNRLEFRATLGTRIFCCVFVLLGCGVVAASSKALASRGDGLGPVTLLPVVIGSIFVLVGFSMLRRVTNPIVFDKREGFFWKGRTEPSQLFDHTGAKDLVRLNEVYAVQLISELCRGKNSSYCSYELNLVLRDGSRLNVVDHGSATKIRLQAQIVAEFLGVPVWDAA